MHWFIICKVRHAEHAPPKFRGWRTNDWPLKKKQSNTLALIKLFTKIRRSSKRRPLNLSFPMKVPKICICGMHGKGGWHKRLLGPALGPSDLCGGKRTEEALGPSTTPLTPHQIWAQVHYNNGLHGRDCPPLSHWSLVVGGAGCWCHWSLV